MKTKITIVKSRFIIGVGLSIISLIKISDFKKTGCLATWTTPNVCGEGALYYYYLYVGVFILGLIFLLTSFKKVK